MTAELSLPSLGKEQKNTIETNNNKLDNMNV